MSYEITVSVPFVSTCKHMDKPLETGIIDQEDEDCDGACVCECCGDVVDIGERYWYFYPENNHHSHCAYYMCDKCKTNNLTIKEVK